MYNTKSRQKKKHGTLSDNLLCIISYLTLILTLFYLEFLLTQLCDLSNAIYSKNNQNCELFLSLWTKQFFLEQTKENIPGCLRASLPIKLIT
jgi:hypothetical protein